MLATVAVPAGPSVSAFRAGRTPVTHGLAKINNVVYRT